MTGRAGEQNAPERIAARIARLHPSCIFPACVPRARRAVSPKGCHMHHTPVQHRYMRPSPAPRPSSSRRVSWLPRCHSGHAQSTATYSNPVLPGDYPDPSVIRVGDTFWATATTSQWAPLFPLMKSADLVNWTRAGAVFQDPPAWSAGSYWAPEIAQDRGRFFVYYTARRKNGPLCVAVASARQPQGPYTDHGPMMCQDAGSIDAALVDGRGGAALSGLEGRRQQPQDAHAHLGAAPLGRRHGADRHPPRVDPEHCSVGGAPGRGSVHPPTRRVVLHVLFIRRLLWTGVQLQAGRRAGATSARPVGTEPCESDSEREPALEMPRSRQPRVGRKRPHVPAVPRVRSRGLPVRRAPGPAGRGDVDAAGLARNQRRAGP